MIETCFFCEMQHRPMPRYTLKADVPSTPEKPSLIYVCYIRVLDHSEVEIHDECRKKAEALGYEYRRDLTPTR